MKTQDVDFPVSIERIRCSHEFATALTSSQIDSLATLSSRSLGTVITDCRSSWVRFHELDAFVFFIKTYDYSTARDRWRGIGRTTWLARSRTRRERDAYRWLSAHGFACPRVLAFGEHRQRGFLLRSVLVTEAWPGQRVDAWLRQLPLSETRPVLEALSQFVQQLHEAGFRDRNLDLRNILAKQSDSGWTFCKIDSPRFRTVPAGRKHDALARADWLRLRNSCAEIGFELPEAQN